MTYSSSSSKTVRLPVGSAEMPANPYLLGTYGSGATCEDELEMSHQSFVMKTRMTAKHIKIGRIE